MSGGSSLRAWLIQRGFIHEHHFLAWHESGEISLKAVALHILGRATALLVCFRFG